MSALTFAVLVPLFGVLLPPAAASAQTAQQVRRSPMSVRHAEPVNNDVSELAIGDSTKLLFITSMGTDPFELRAAPGFAVPSHPRGEGIFYRSLEMSRNERVLYGASWDELYRVNPTTGVRKLLGKVRGENTFRAWFSSPTTYEDVALPGATTVDWVLHASIEAPNVGTSGFVDVIDEQGSTAVSESVSATLLDNAYSIDDATTFEFGIDWIWDFPSIPLVLIDIDWDVVGASGPAFAQGMFGAESDAFNVGNDDATLPLAGISFSPDGALYGLSEGDWDVHGGPGLYELFIETNGVRAEHICQLDVSMNAIEFLPWGPLLGAGDVLYEIDPETCDAVEIGTTGPAPVTDMDWREPSYMYGVTLPEGSPSELILLYRLTEGPVGLTLPLDPAGAHWGLATQARRLDGIPTKEELPGGGR